MSKIKWLNEEDKNIEYGFLTVINDDKERSIVEKHHFVFVKCRCGLICSKRYSAVKLGYLKTCGKIDCQWREKVAEETRRKKNNYDLTHEYGIGYTSNGKEFYFDLEDYDKIKEYTWYMDSKGYIRTNMYNRNTNKRDYMFMHDFIMGLEHNMVTNADHIGGYCTVNDNRKSNLRVATNSENNINQRVRKDNTSGIKGVNWDDKKQKWISRISVNKKRIYLGAFDDIEEAIKIRKEYENKYHNEYSYDNSQQIFKAVDNNFLVKYHG